MLASNASFFPGREELPQQKRQRVCGAGKPVKLFGRQRLSSTIKGCDVYRLAVGGVVLVLGASFLPGRPGRQELPQQKLQRVYGTGKPAKPFGRQHFEHHQGL